MALNGGNQVISLARNVGYVLNVDALKILLKINYVVLRCH